MRDITYCANECLNTECPRHITKADGEVSVAKLKGTGECELDDCETCRYYAPYFVKQLGYEASICTHPFIESCIAPCIGWMRKP